MKRSTPSSKETDSRPALVSGSARDQDELQALRHLEELDFRLGLEVSTLDIGLVAGKARIRGTVSDQDELDAIEETLGESGGVEDLECLVQIAPDRREEDKDRARLLQESLEEDPELGADGENIMVACVGKKVILRGTVTTERVRVLAGLWALNLEEVTRLRNRLVVQTDRRA